MEMNLRCILISCGIAVGIGCAHYLDDSPSDWEADKATQASLNDALRAAQAERPELWTAEQKARARVAAGLVAQGVQP
jgi:hypothetical protein